MRFPRQEYWSGLSFPPPGDLPHPGEDPALQADSSPSEPPGTPAGSGAVVLKHVCLCLPQVIFYKTMCPFTHFKLTFWDGGGRGDRDGEDM